VALALFLFTYRGYNNRYYWVDRATAIVGGFAALGVAFFPARPPDGVPVPSWWTPPTGVLHYASATILLSTFAVFSLLLFRLRTPGAPLTPAKQLSRKIHLCCGIIIVLAMVWTRVRAAAQLSLFVSESVALAAFAVSWLVKGRAPKTIGTAVRAMF
jgi:hypothetical protein